jgi:hypothetical protein
MVRPFNGDADSYFVRDEISAKEKDRKEPFIHPAVPRRPERSEERRWPSPTPLPLVPPEDAGKVLKQILDRLDAIEKRLEGIEKLLAERKSSHKTR